MYDDKPGGLFPAEEWRTLAPAFWLSATTNIVLTLTMLYLYINYWSQWQSLWQLVYSLEFHGDGTATMLRHGSADSISREFIEGAPASMFVFVLGIVLFMCMGPIITLVAVHRVWFLHRQCRLHVYWISGRSFRALTRVTVVLGAVVVANVVVAHFSHSIGYIMFVLTWAVYLLVFRRVVWR